MTKHLVSPGLDGSSMEIIWRKLKPQPKVVAEVCNHSQTSGLLPANHWMGMYLSYCSPANLMSTFSPKTKCKKWQTQFFFLSSYRLHLKQQPEAVIRLLSRVVIKETAAVCVHLSSVHGAVDYNNKGRFFKLVMVLAEGSRRVLLDGSQWMDVGF